MLWLIAVFTEIVLETIIALRYRVTARSNPDDGLRATAVMYGLGVAPIGIIYVLASTDGVAGISYGGLLWTVVASALFALANVMIYRSYSKMDASLYATINSSKYLLIIIGAFVLLGDALDSRQLVGAGLILSACVYISVISRRRESGNVQLRYVVLAFFASAIVAFAQMSERVAVVAAPMATYILIGWSLQAVLLFVVAAFFDKRSSSLKKVVVPSLVLTGVLRGLAGVCIVYAVANTQNASLVFSLAAAKVVVVSIVAYIILKERTHAVSRFGAAIVTSVGIVLVVT